MSAYSIVSMRVQGHSAFAVWIGYAVDPDNPKRVLGARLLGTYPTKAAAESAARGAIEDAENAGARLADDHFCPGCGARGYRYTCPRCSQPERGMR